EDILLRSDAKDLVPWKSVCKSWYSLISDPRFVKAHLKIARDNNDNNNSGNELGQLRIAMPTYWKIPNEKRLYQLNLWRVVGSYNGLVCISCIQGDPLIMVNNPCIKELRTLPMAPLVSQKSMSGLCWSFAHDPSTDDYKVVMVIRKSDDSHAVLVQVLSLKSNTWKLIGQFNYCFINDIPGMLFNGKLHWFVFDYDNTRNGHKVILSFDLSREEFKVFPQTQNPIGWLPRLGMGMTAPP
ncbi:F-box/kelch-repeat protein-like protein isoform X1, partial [Tanacetum coccineum]